MAKIKGLIPAKDITAENIVTLLNENRMTARIDDDGDILANVSGTNIIMDIKGPLLRMHAIWSVREGIRRDEVEELVAAVNANAPLVRCSIPKNPLAEGEGYRIWADYQLLRDGDLTTTKLLECIRFFVRWMNQALDEYDIQKILG